MDRARTVENEPVGPDGEWTGADPGGEFGGLTSKNKAGNFSCRKNSRLTFGGKPPSVSSYRYYDWFSKRESEESCPENPDLVPISFLRLMFALATVPVMRSEDFPEGSTSCDLTEIFNSEVFIISA